MKFRTCSKCHTPKELNDQNFCPNKRYAEGLTRICRVCNNAYRLEWTNGDRSQHMHEHRAYELLREMKKYGTTVEWYRDKLIEQLGLCNLCQHLNRTQGTIQRLTVDHSHDCCNMRTKSCGKCLRGLLCSKCNLRLAYLEQTIADLRNPETGEVDLRNALQPDSWTRRAMQYLKKYSSKTQETQHDQEAV